MELPFGKRVTLGNYVILKYSKTLSKKDLKMLRKAQGIPDEIQKHLNRGSLPYILISTVSGSWSIEWCIGMGMYNAINEIPVAKDGDGNIVYYGNGYHNLYTLINNWFCYTTTVGDFEYQQATSKAMSEYLERAYKAKAEPTAEEVAESEKAADEAFEMETGHAVGDDIAETKNLN
jgi:hypothetical protein